MDTITAKHAPAAARLFLAVVMGGWIALPVMYGLASLKAACSVLPSILHVIIPVF